MTITYDLLLVFGLGQKKKKKKEGTTMRYHYTPVTVVKIPNTDNLKCWQGCEASGTLFRCRWGCKILNYSHFGKIVWQFLNKRSTLIYNPVIVLLAIYPNELKSPVHTKINTQMFTTALFIIAKT